MNRRLTAASTLRQDGRVMIIMIILYFNMAVTIPYLLTTNVRIISLLTIVLISNPSFILHSWLNEQV